MINSNRQMHSDSESSASSCTSHLLPAPSSFHKRKAGRKKFRETRHPFYRGVRERKGGRWVCEVREPQKKSRIWVGTFATPEMAARAYDVAALALRGTSTALNFADSARALPRAKSSSAADIQSAAVAAAEAFRPESSSVELSLVKNQETSCVEKPPANSLVFLDEEAMFNMPNFLSNMAEAMLITPPAMAKGFNGEDMDHIMDLSLWTF